MNAMASQITSHTIVYPAVYSRRRRFLLNSETKSSEYPSDRPIHKLVQRMPFLWLTIVSNLSVSVWSIKVIACQQFNGNRVRMTWGVPYITDSCLIFFTWNACGIEHIIRYDCFIWNVFAISTTPSPGNSNRLTYYLTASSQFLSFHLSYSINVPLVH